MDPEQVLQELIAGNRRYSLGAGIHPRQTLHRRDEMLNGAHPVAAIISCSDSRVPPEIIFDCGLGDLFVIRSAGHVVDNTALASVQYAAEHQGVELVLIVGHGDCGAVKSAMMGIQASGPLGALLAGIQPAVAASSGRAVDPLECAVIENIRLNLRPLKEAEWAKKPMIRGAYYNLKSGLVALDPEI